MIEAVGIVSKRKYAEGNNKAAVLRTLDEKYSFISRNDDNKQINAVYPEPLLLRVAGRPEGEMPKIRNPRLQH